MQETTPETTPTPRRSLRQLINDHAQTAAFWATIVITLFLLVCYRAIGDRTWWSACIVIWPSLLWCLGLVPMSLFCFNIKRPRMILIALLVVGFFQIVTVEWRSLLRSESLMARELITESDQITPLRLAIWNMADYMSNKADVLDTLSEFTPDLCLLQETGDGLQSFQPEELTGPWEGYHWIDVGDCGVLSRYPITALDNPDAIRASFEQLCGVDLPDGRRALVANVHLMMPPIAWNIAFSPSHSSYREGHAERVAQYEPLMALIETHRAALDTDTVILAGDFNVGADMHSLAPIREQLRDVWLTHGIGWGGTAISSFPVARIDHCWVSDDITPVAARVIPTDVSDHRLLVVDLLIPAIAPTNAL